MLDPTFEKVLQIAASVFFLIAIMLLVLGQTDKIREDSDSLFNTNLSAFVFCMLAALIFIILTMEFNLENFTQLVASIFFLLATLLIALGQTDRVRNDEDTLFGTNIAAFVLASIAGIMVMIIAFMLPFEKGGKGENK